MGAEDRTAAALAYAWWLTGEEDTARSAVRVATASPHVAAAGYDEHMPTLLREVRAAAPAPTMCPASELALLHDAHGLPLEVAARLVGLPAADARVELAHGRLEALAETVLDPFAHPERLGGLAVRNPADVAHARQCASCAEAAHLIERGREELLDLAAMPVDAYSQPPAPAEPNRRLLVYGLVATVVFVILLLIVRAGLGA